MRSPISNIFKEHLTITWQRLAPLVSLALLASAIVIVASLPLSHRGESIALVTVLAATAALHRLLAPRLPRGRW